MKRRAFDVAELVQAEFDAELSAACFVPSRARQISGRRFDEIG
jgi:hypothetical protein